MIQEVWFATSGQLYFLYSIISLTLIYLVWRYHNSFYEILFILLFYPALFAFLGKSIQDAYKVATLALALLVLITGKSLNTFNRKDFFLTLCFLLFTIFYFVSCINSNDKWTIILSQYSRYLIIFCLWFIVRNNIFSGQWDIKRMNGLLFDIFIMQILISIGKLIIFRGAQIESIVGSISHIGGAAGTSLPVLGFVFLWFYRKGQISQSDSLYILGLMLIGFLAAKRAVWFILPVVIAIFMIYIPRARVSRTIFAGILLAPLAFYVGLRLTPTLNPENKVWGSFNMSYAFTYAEDYQFGSNKQNVNRPAEGRGGATLLLWDKLMSGKKFTYDDLFGKGQSQMYATDYQQFNQLNPEINHKGAATGIYQSYVSMGYMGIFSTLLFFSLMIWQCRVSRIRNALAVILGWEYFMYTGLIFRTPAFMFLIIYFIHYGNYLTKEISLSPLMLKDDNN